MNSTENIQKGYRNGLSKTAVEFKNCERQLFTLTMCLPACLWAQIAKTPFNYTITAQTLLAKCDDYRFQWLILRFPALRKKYRSASMFIMTRAVSTPRDVERRESGSMVFFDTIEPFPESSRKHENTALKSTMIKQWNSNAHFAVGLTPFHPWVCLYHTYAVRNLILRCLTDSLMTILSKSNYHVRLNVKMDIAHSISFNLNFGNGYYFVLRLKQHFFDDARFFLSE